MLDLYATCADVAKRDFNLLGVTCLLIASKLEETLRPRLQELLHVSRLRVYEGEVKRMEQRVLTALDFDVHFSDISDFMNALRGVPFV